MNAQTLFQLFLVLHLIGFTIMGGTVVADYTIQRRLRKVLIPDKPKAVTILEGTAGFPVLIGIGVLLIISAGVGMVVILKSLVVNMLWFRIKMILVILVLLNGAVILRKDGGRLRELLIKNSIGNNGAILALKSRMTLFHTAQLILFIIIFVLSVFRF